MNAKTTSTPETANTSGSNPVVDIHTHVFCWGERPEEGFLSDAITRSWLVRFILRAIGLRREPGEDLSEKIRNMLFRHLNGSTVDHAVVLAQDAIYRVDGSRDDAATPFYVSNDYVLRLADEHPKILPGVSINPWRADADAELERCYAAGARLVKIHTSIQGVDPAEPRFEPFYRRAADLGVILMFHTGYEHSSPVVSQQYSDPTRLERALDCGGVIIAAHCGTCAFYDPEDFYPRFIEMMRKHSNLYGDTAILATYGRWKCLGRLERADPSILDRVLHGSDYPLPPSRLPFVRRIGPLPAARRNPLQMDLEIKRTFDLGEKYIGAAADLLAAAGALKLPEMPLTR